jgi:hypothetical protein
MEELVAELGAAFLLIGIVGACVSSRGLCRQRAHPDYGFEGGLVHRGSGGSGTLTFRGRRYPLSIGGLSVGLVFGASETHLVGRSIH